jgi:hypothetical protein
LWNEETRYGREEDSYTLLRHRPFWNANWEDSSVVKALRQGVRVPIVAARNQAPPDLACFSRTLGSGCGGRSPGYLRRGCSKSDARGGRVNVKAAMPKYSSVTDAQRHESVRAQLCVPLTIRCPHLQPLAAICSMHVQCKPIACIPEFPSIALTTRCSPLCKTPPEQRASSCIMHLAS